MAAKPTTTETTIQHDHPSHLRCGSTCPVALAGRTHYPPSHPGCCGQTYGGPTSTDPDAIDCLTCSYRGTE